MSARKPRRVFVWGAGLIVLLALGIGVFLLRWAEKPPKMEGTAENSGLAGPTPETLPKPGSPQPTRPRVVTSRRPTDIPPEQMVAEHRRLYVRHRLELARRWAQEHGETLTPEIEQFFQAAEAGDWEQTQAWAKLLLGQRAGGEGDGSAPSNALRAILHETLGVAELVHKWPARALLDYGDRILDSLPAGTVYVGGTDPGRFIPTLLNETTQGDRRIILTQNQLADATYLDYVRFLYGERLKTLTTDDSQQAFGNYLQDAMKRARHDQQFPHAPKQVAPDEDIRFTEDTRIQISGAGAVMRLNGLLLQTLLAKNPEARFALEESFPIPSTYEGAAVCGPLICLQSAAGKTMPSEVARGALTYWDEMAAQVTAELASSEFAEVRAAYAKLAQGQANLLAHQNFAAEAEHLYAVARRLAPEALAPIEDYAVFLGRQGRASEALKILDAFARQYPDHEAAVLKVRERLAPSPSGVP